MTSQYRQLRDKWYRKLQKSGFEDIEVIDSPTESLHDWHHYIFQRYCKKHQVYKFFMTQNHYIAATHFLTHYNFNDEFEKKIWEFYCEGLSYREIAKIVRSNKDKVNQIILRLLEEMK